MFQSDESIIILTRTAIDLSNRDTYEKKKKKKIERKKYAKFPKNNDDSSRIEVIHTSSFPFLI